MSDSQIFNTIVVTVIVLLCVGIGLATYAFPKLAISIACVIIFLAAVGMFFNKVSK